jgi:hypothetical protein
VLGVRRGYAEIIMAAPRCPARRARSTHMSQPRHVPPHLVLLSAGAWAAAEELAELTGSRPGKFIEAMLLDLRERMAEAEPHEDLPAGVIPISRGRRRNHRSRRPPRFRPVASGGRPPAKQRADFE